MRCPKCHYLSFEPEPRCKNCGYDLDLSESDLELHVKATDQPLGDLALRDLKESATEPALTLGPMRREREVIKATAPRPVSRSSPGAVALEPPPPPVRKPSPAPPPSPALRAFEAPRRTSDYVAPSDPMLAKVVAPPMVRAADAPVEAPATPVAPVTTELPLFVKGLPAPAATTDVSPPATPAAPAFLAAATAATEAEFAEETPLVTLPTEPRAPLAVRRPSPEIASPKPRSAPARKLGPLDRDLLEDLQRIERNERREAAAQAGEPAPVDAGEIAGAVTRVAAAAIDATILGTLSLGVLWVTLRWVDLSFADAGVLPIVPTALFLLLVALGYLLMFTAAGGQTLGKMAVGLRVVGDDDGHWTSLTISQAFYRSALVLPSVLALVGFLPALIGDHRALHDRLSHTRVVRA